MYLLSTKYYYSNIKQNTVSPNNYIITIKHQNSSTKQSIRKMANKILDHINIIKESRRLHENGKVISWEDFVKDADK